MKDAPIMAIEFFDPPEWWMQEKDYNGRRIPPRLMSRCFVCDEPYIHPHLIEDEA